MIVRKLEDAYQMALKAEETLSKKQSQRRRGKNHDQREGTTREKIQKVGEETGSSCYHLVFSLGYIKETPR
jgi:hypothetical protein